MARKEDVRMTSTTLVWKRAEKKTLSGSRRKNNIKLPSGISWHKIGAISGDGNELSGSMKEKKFLE